MTPYDEDAYCKTILLPVALAERSVGQCLDLDVLSMSPADLSLHLRASLNDAEESAFDLLLASQTHAMDALFHRALQDSVGRDGIVPETLALAMAAQKSCRQTVETLGRIRARKSEGERRLQLDKAKLRRDYPRMFDPKRIKNLVEQTYSLDASDLLPTPAAPPVLTPVPAMDASAPSLPFPPETDTPFPVAGPVPVPREDPHGR